MSVENFSEDHKKSSAELVILVHYGHIRYANSQGKVCGMVSGTSGECALPYILSPFNTASFRFQRPDAL